MEARVYAEKLIRVMIVVGVGNECAFKSNRVLMMAISDTGSSPRSRLIRLTKAETTCRTILGP
jgi:hypothetical protein